MRVGLTGGRSLVISSTVLLLGQVPSGVGNGNRSCSVCGAPRPSLTPSSAGVKMGKGRVVLLGSCWCSLTPLSTVPTLKTPEGHVCFSERACHCRDSVSLREVSFMFIVCLQPKTRVEVKICWSTYCDSSDLEHLLEDLNPYLTETTEQMTRGPGCHSATSHLS